MPRMIFVNLPVGDVARSTAFYEAIGATLDPRFSNAEVSSMVFSDAITIMLPSHDHFRQFTPKKIAAAGDTIEVLNVEAMRSAISGQALAA